MANLARVKRPNIYVELLGDETPRQVVFTMESIALIEEEYGSLEEGLEALTGGEKFKTKDIIFFMYVGLMSLDDNITKEFISKRMDVRDMQYYFEVLTEAITMDIHDDTVNSEEQPVGDTNPN